MYIGWNSDKYNVFGDRKEKVEHAFVTTDGYVLKCGNRNVKSREKLDEVGTLPLENAALVFDENNENSIVTK